MGRGEEEGVLLVESLRGEGGLPTPVWFVEQQRRIVREIEKFISPLDEWGNIVIEVGEIAS